MKKIIIVTEAGTLNISSGGMATANVWLEINECQFPMQHWNDSVVVILSWWTLALSRVLSGISAKEIVYFMEGPYAVELTMLTSKKLRFRAFKGTARAEEVATGEETAASFALELISRSKEILDECKRLGWWSKDAEALEKSLKALKMNSTSQQLARVVPKKN